MDSTKNKMVIPFSKSEPLFCIDRLSHCYGDGIRALDGVDFTIAAGERIALVGPNGSGKTTLIKHLCGLLRPDSGHVLYRGQSLAGQHLAVSRLEIGLLFQDPDDQLFGHTLLDDAAFGPLNQGLSQQQARQAASRALQAVYLDDKLYKLPHHLSYGQKKRAALAGLLAMRSQVLLLDEPTANLDPRQEQVFLDLLKTFTGTLIIVSHDLILLYELCDRALALDHGRIGLDCPMEDLVARPGELRGLGLDFSFRLVMGEASHEAKPIPHCSVVNQLPGAAIKTVSNPLVELRNYDFRYPDGTLALNHINVRMGAGEKIALVGENGAGKTTLLSCLLGLLQGSGEYRFNGQTMNRKLQKSLWQDIGMVFQDSADQLFCPTVAEEVAFGLRHLKMSKDELQLRTRQALTMVRLDGFEHRIPLHMSGGERKRLALACVLAMSPTLLILDEPSAGLDPQSEELLMNILRDLDISLLLVSHDMYIVKVLTCRTLVMHQGHIIDDLPTAAFVADPRLGSLNGLAYAFRQRGSQAILNLQHSHEHNHPHRHLHSHIHSHNGIEHDHLHEHAHEHSHRFLHSHPGDEQAHSHPPRRYHDHFHSDHDIDPHKHD